MTTLGCPKKSEGFIFPARIHISCKEILKRNYTHSKSIKQEKGKKEKIYSAMV